MVHFDGRVLILRWMDPEVQGRYGTMVYVRCAPEGAKRPRPKGKPKAKPAAKPAAAEACRSQASAGAAEAEWRPAPPKLMRARDFVHGPWRAVPVLGVTQIISWGSIFYTPVLIVPLIAAERGWSIAFAMGGFSVGLLTAGLVSPLVGRSIDRYGGHVVMTVGSLIGALGLFLHRAAAQPLAYLAVWMVLGVAMAANLYDSAFATLGRIFGGDARRPITALTLAGGFASTVSWPATHYLHRARRLARHLSDLCRAARLRVARRCMPSRCRATATKRTARRRLRRSRRRGCCRAHGLMFVLVASAFAAYAFVPSGLSAHLLAIFGRAGIDAGTVVWIGALFGPAQVGARLIEFSFGRDLHPLWVARFALASAARGLRHAGAARHFGADRGGLCADVRRRQRARHHHARRGAAGAVRRRRLRAADRAAGRAVSADAVGGAAGDGLRGRAHLRSGGAGAGRRLSRRWRSPASS